MEKQFRALRIIGTVFKIFAWIVLIFGVLGGLFMLLAGITGGISGEYGYGYRGGPMLVAPTDLGLGALVIGILGGGFIVMVSVLYFLFLYATGDAIYLALAIEQNTRETVYYLKGGDNLPREV